jgi:hypothetical protein
METMTEVIEVTMSSPVAVVTARVKNVNKPEMMDGALLVKSLLLM